MPHHEEKVCPRCGAHFECKMGTITLCQCSSVPLDDDERAYIASRFQDCLCANCLWELKQEFKRKNITA
ncbi:MAG: cysteine-rich CWC family protein [Chloroherpetonaceae bacterium]